MNVNRRVCTYILKLSVVGKYIQKTLGYFFMPHLVTVLLTLASNWPLCLILSVRVELTHD